MKIQIACAATLMTLSLAAAAAADTPADLGGRFTMAPVEGGFLRLDKQTGSVAMCSRTGTAWGCVPVEDRTGDAAAPDVSRLEQENRDLRDRIRALEDTIGAKPPLEGPPGGKAQLPSDEDVDQALDYLERVYKKVRDRIKDLDKPLPPKEPPPPPPPPPPKGAL